MLELHAYSGAIVGFFRATVANPDILVEADLDEQSVVLDVGAFVGEWSERIDERYEPTILAFEPNPNAFRSLERRMGRRPNVALFEIGLGATEAVTTLDTAQGPGATLYGDPASDHLERVQIRDVVAVLADQGIDHVDLLKVNIEGAEFDLIDRLIDTGWIDRIDTISIQFHEWHPHAHRRRRRIRSELARTHVEAWCYPWVWELWTRAPAATAPDQKMIGTESPG